MKTAKENLLRTVQRVYPLEITHDCEQLLLYPGTVTFEKINEQSNDCKSVEKMHIHTRAGRKVNPPNRLNL